MMRGLFALGLAGALLTSCTFLPVANPAQHTDVALAGCAVTPPFEDQPPDDPNADPFAFGKWHINAERTLWVGIPPSGVWHTAGEKVIWIRPAGTELQVRGQQLDAEAEPLRVDQPCCYPTGFQVNGLDFPTAGCWEVSATAGVHALRFVIEVVDPPAQAAQPLPRGIDPASPLATSMLQQACDSRGCELRSLTR